MVSRKSIVWEEFQLVGPSEVCCNTCLHILKTKNSNTTNLWGHVRAKHHEIYAQLEKRQYKKIEESRKKRPKEDAEEGSSKKRVVSIKDCFERHTKYEDSHEKQKKFNQAIMRFIKNLQPFSVVEGEGFNKLIAVADPKLKVKHCMTFSRDKLPQLFEEFEKRLQAVLQVKKPHLPAQTQK